MTERTRTILRWTLPSIVALVLATGAWFGLGMWERHQAQHRQADADHQTLVQVVNFINRLAIPRP